MLQALRFVIQGAGAKVDPSIRKSITTTLLGMLGHDEVQQVFHFLSVCYLRDYKSFKNKVKTKVP